ncbi:MAG: hypothetical protein WB991_05505, partial [Candidatus Sulfotelmatobacter sp.]
NLPREICGMSQNVTEGEAIHSDRAAEVSKGCSTPRDRRKTRTAACRALRTVGRDSLLSAA